MLAKRRGARVWQVAAGLSAAVALCVVVWGLEQRRPVWELERAGVEVTTSTAGVPVALSFAGAAADEAALALAAQLETVVRIDLSKSQVQRSGLVHLQRLPNLKSLDLSNTTPGRGTLADVACIATLRHLRLDGCEWVTDDELRLLRGPHQLQFLSLNSTTLTARGLSELLVLPRLEMLEIDHCAGLDQEALQILVDLPALQTATARGMPVPLARLRELFDARPGLDLAVDRFDLSEIQRLLDYGAGVTLDHQFLVTGVALDAKSDRGSVSLPGPIWAGSARWHRLSMRANDELRRSQNSVAPVDDATLALLPTFPHIENLWLDNVAVTDAGVAHLSQLPDLHWLTLQNVEITGEGLAGLRALTTLTWTESPNAVLTEAAMQGIGGLQSLTDLDLDVRMPERGVRHLASLSALERLSLTGPISGDDLRHLASLSALEELSLTGPISGDGLRHIGSLPRLRSLGLRDVDVTAAGLEGLAASANVAFISLYRCRVDAGALAALERLDTLESLGINRSDAATADLQSLLERRPTLSVYVDGKQAARADER